LVDLSEGYQQTIADKAVKEEAYRQYRQKIGKERRGKTSYPRKLTDATVVTSEMVIELREQREKSDAVKAARKAKKESALSKTIQMRQNVVNSTARSTLESSPTSPQTTTLPVVDEADGWWEEIEALEVGSDGIGELDGGGLWLQSGYGGNANYKIVDSIGSIGARIGLTVIDGNGFHTLGGI